VTGDANNHRSFLTLIAARFVSWRSSLLGGTAINVTSNITSVISAIALTPLIVDKLGLREFGFYSVVTAALAYVQIADGGLPIITIRHIARAHREGNLLGIRTAVATSLLAAMVAGTALILVSIAFALLVPDSFMSNISGGWKGTTALAIAALGVTIMSNSLAAVPRAQGRWDLDGLVQIASQITSAAATVTLLLGGTRLLTLGVALAVTSCTQLLGYVLIAIRADALGGLGFRPSRVLLRDLRKQGASLQIVVFVGATNAQADRLMLLPFASLSFIGAYALGSRIAVLLRGLPLQALGPLMTRFALSEEHDGDSARLLYRVSSRVMLEFVTPGLLICYAACFPAVLTWLGPSHVVSAEAAALLGIGYAINLNTGPGTSLAIALGHAELDRDYNLFGLALNVTLSAILGFTFGPWGVVGATILGLSLSSVWLLARVDRQFAIGLGWSIISSASVRTAWCGAVTIGGATVVAASVLAPLGRVDNALLAFLACLVGAAWIGRHWLIPRWQPVAGA
jgi:O-antigen/teichoic acid export membrane protein